MTDWAQKIVNNIYKFGELVSCQPLTTVGVALYMLNLKKNFDTEANIARAVDRRIQTIKENYDRKVR